MDDQLRSLIASGALGAITIDTSVFDAQRRGLEMGLLRRIEQFRGYALKVLMVDVVQDELVRHIADDARNTQGALKSALKAVAGPWGVTDTMRAEIIQLVGGGQGPEQQAAARVSAWLDRAQAIRLVASDLVTLPAVMELYFAGDPPFAMQGTKKHEFPDALALLALDAWARANATKVLVVSSDGDWKRFCEHSEWLVLRDDLSAVLGAFQQPTARYAARRLAETLQQGDPIGLKDALAAAVRAQDHKLSLELEMRTSRFAEHKETTVDVLGVLLPPGPEATDLFESVDFSNGVVVVRVPFATRIRATALFDLRAFDATAAVFVPAGIGSSTFVRVIEMEALVSLDGKIPEKMAIKSVEILPHTHQLPIREITPMLSAGQSDDGEGPSDAPSAPWIEPSHGGLF